MSDHRNDPRFVPWNPQRPATSPGWITDENGCDIWYGCRSRGYARGSDGSGGAGLVHRIRYEREIGPIPEGAELDHYKCDNGPGGCCNPFHCRPVTCRENTLRSNSLSSVNAAKSNCPQGHPLSPGNLERYSADRGERKCKLCVAERSRRYAERKGETLKTARRADYHARKRLLSTSEKKSRRGDTHPAAVLTESDVRAIRADERNNSVVARAYGVSRENIRAIRTRRSWRHVD